MELRTAKELRETVEVFQSKIPPNLIMTLETQALLGRVEYYYTEQLSVAQTDTLIGLGYVITYYRKDRALISW